MKLIDLNIFIYATNNAVPQHEPARRWLQAAFQGGETIGMPWAICLGFVRLSTSSRVFPKALAPAQAMEVVSGWLDHPIVQPVEPSHDHWDTVCRLLTPLGTAGNLTSDAHLAALAIEHRATLYSADSDFGRFAGLRWKNPLA